jgi:hypothetical protein
MRNLGLVLIALFMVSSCKIDTAEPTFRNFYLFDLPVSMSNVKKEYNVMDILWLEISIPDKMLEDLDSGQDIFIGNARFPISLQAQEISNAPVDTNQVEIILQNGELSQDSLFDRNGDALFHFGCPSTTYVFKIGVQFKKPGGYLLNLNPGSTLRSIVFNETTDCSIFENTTVLPNGVDLGTVTYLFDTEDLNLDVFSDFSQSNSLNTTVNEVPERIDARQTFFVKVI